MIRSPFQIKPPQKKAPGDFGDLLSLLQDFSKKYSDIQRIHQELSGLVPDIHQKIAAVSRGPKGDTGYPGSKGADGVSPEVDYEKIVRMVLPYIPKVKNGKDGKNGTAPSVDEILESIFSSKRLTLDQIVDLRPHLDNLRRVVMRGSGDTVAAGSGITLTSSGGVKTISVSGGGVTELSAAETPNGNLKVFTFAAATAQPSYIVSDNVWMKATSKAGNTNWTWNNGTKKATLTIPPTDDIFAIV